MHWLGEITLNTALLIYIVWFLPQIILNAKRRDTEGLSLWMHGLLFLGYIADLIYGFGRHMPWQYRMVTIVGLISLVTQHYQIGRYGLHTKAAKQTYVLLTVVYFSLLTYAFYNIDVYRRSKNFYDIIGMLSNACWFSYVLPQIIKNYHRKSTEGLSRWFVGLSIALSVCDTISAWALGYDYPSKIGAPLTVIKKSILLYQIKHYGKKIRTALRIA